MSIEHLEANPKLREITSPRTLNACRQLEIHPNELLVSHYEAQLLNIEDADKRSMAKEHYNVIRQKKMLLVKGARATVMAEDSKRHNPIISPMSTNRTDEIMSLSQAEPKKHAEPENDILAKEAKRIEMVQQRLEKEIHRYVERESFLAGQREKLQIATRAEEKKARLLQKTLEKKRLEAEAEVKIKVERQKQVEIQDALERKRAARVEFDLEAEMQRQEVLEQKKLLVAIRAQDEERRIKMEEREAKLESDMTLQLEASENRRFDMEKRDELRESALFERRLILKAKLQEERNKSHDLVIQALERNKKASEDKKLRYQDHEKQANDRNIERRKDLEEILEKNKNEREYDQKEREIRLSSFYTTLSDRRSHMIDSRTEQEVRYKKVLEARTIEKESEMFQKSLKSQEMQDNVDRIARIAENRRLELLASIENSTNRSQRIKIQRDELLNQRKDAVRVSLISKHNMKEVMDKMRNSTNMSHFANLTSKLSGSSAANSNADAGGNQVAGDMDKDEA